MSHHDDDLTTIDISTLDEVTGGAVAASSSTAQLTTAARHRPQNLIVYANPTGDQRGHV